MLPHAGTGEEWMNEELFYSLWEVEKIGLKSASGVWIWEWEMRKGLAQPG